MAVQSLAYCLLSRGQRGRGGIFCRESVSYSQALWFASVYCTIHYTVQCTLQCTVQCPVQSTVGIAVFSTVHMCGLSRHSGRFYIISQLRPNLHCNYQSELYPYISMAISRYITKKKTLQMHGGGAKRQYIVK